MLRSAGEVMRRTTVTTAKTVVTVSLPPPARHFFISMPTLMKRNMRTAPR